MLPSGLCNPGEPTGYDKDEKCDNGLPFRYLFRRHLIVDCHPSDSYAAEDDAECRAHLILELERALGAAPVQIVG